jgi:hypothetical protein
MRMWRLTRLALVAALALFLVGAGPVAAARSASGVGPKVVLIVGPVGSLTPYYRRLADETAAAAAKLTPNVVKVYSPDATWERVKAALQGASIVVYLGHGNGWPSIYRSALYPPTQNGFGLNPHAGAADAHQYFGEDKIASQIHLAPNAVVVFSHLCYASGNTEPGLAEGTLDQAQQRVDNYAAGFLAAGAGAVIADAYLSPQYYVKSVLSGHSSVDSIWRRAPNRNNHFLAFDSVRTKGAIAQMDPDNVTSGFHRSLVIKSNLTSSQVLNSAIRRPIEVTPVTEPSLIGLGVTFGSPDLTTTPTAGTSTRLVLPMAPDAIDLLPKKVMVGTRWDRLDAGADPASLLVTGAASGGAAPAATVGPDPSALPGASASPGTGSTGSGSSGANSPPLQLPDLVVPETPGEVVAPVRARVLASGGLSVPVKVPTAPGLYRLVTTLHDPDGLAYDAATQALLPALVVRVTGPRTAVYRAPTTATAVVGKSLALTVDVANLGNTPWGHAATRPKIGEAELVPASRSTLVARWVSLTANLDGTGAAGGTASTILPAGLAPGKTATADFSLTAPPIPGEYLVVLDVIDPDVGSLAALGVPPGIVRVSVGA